MSRFEISARDGAARAGVIQTPHGPVRTPAFVPLASSAKLPLPPSWPVSVAPAAYPAASGCRMAFAFPPEKPPPPTP